jgi:signal transduction histidine kinase
MRMRAFIERERAFSADVSHELRTALAVILSAGEVLLDDESLTPRQKKARIGRSDRAAHDMAELGTALLLMAREEHSLAAGGGCVVADVVRGVVEKQRYLLAGKPVEVEVHTNPELVLSADTGLVEILVSNLI